jgi:hypothetical protein
MFVVDTLLERDAAKNLSIRQLEGMITAGRLWPKHIQLSLMQSK